MRLGGLRCLYFANSLDSGVMYINGEQAKFSQGKTTLIQALCDQQTLSQADLADWFNDQEVMDTITAWVNAGYWYFEEVE
ncbi:hypothetical protein TUM4438_28890 [Shewanella sairae]|uniref:ROXA-like winged helix domain-containing protein n=1 Tax=Shewanella sairae TaxID=190310 RepID=A0ABQ4PJZ7_9GAMM|nr:hypothetical protein TUM4438_28890 [Shewanella sairae]